MKNMKIWSVGLILLLMICGTKTAFAQASTLPSSSMRGTFSPNEKIFVAPSFIIAVNDYLRRYKPTLIEQNDDYVKMTTNNNQINLELTVRQNEYEMVVAVAQDNLAEKSAKIIASINRSFKNQFTRAVSANAGGVYEENGKVMLKPAFINAVNSYLRRYNPKLVFQNDEYVKMTAKYGYQLNLELVIRENTYEIIVSSQKRKNKAQNICAKIATGTNDNFLTQIGRMSIIR